MKNLAAICLARAERMLPVGALCLVLASCKNGSDGGTSPPIVVQRYGLAGTVVDTSGRRLDSVNVYCLYYSTSVPPGTRKEDIPTRPGGVDTFSFKLYQNFPNPFSHSTFIRFSLPRDAEVRLSLVDRLDGSTAYAYLDTLLEGLYQLYLYRLVDNLRLRNGPYIYTLEATASGNIRYIDNKEIFVISDSGSPSTTTDENGSYIFDYERAFVGDSVMVTTDGYNVYSLGLTNTAFLLFRRSGYRSLVISITLFPNILLQRDIVLVKDGQQ